MYKAEYIWIDGTEPTAQLRSKTKVLQDDEWGRNISSCPAWGFDGSSTEQADGNNSEVYLKPRKVFKDPFRGGNNVLVICDTWLPDLKTPHPTNTRHEYAKIMNKVVNSDCWYGFEMEFFMIDPKTKLPIGFPDSGEIPKQGQSGEVSFYINSQDTTNNMFYSNISNYSKIKKLSF